MRPVQRWLSTACLGVVLAAGAPTFVSGQTRPAAATAMCKDGTYSTAKAKRGACANHGGVQTWYAGAKKPSANTDVKNAGKATKEAASEAGTATKDVAKGTAGAVTGAAVATKNATKSAASAITGRPSDAPENATAKCKDGTYSFAKQHRGACSNHGGVAAWFK